MKRLCPACLTRKARVVAVDCPVCEGAGVLELGPSALSLHSPDVVSRAAAIVLEAVARVADSTIPPDEDRIGPLRGAVTILRASGILEAPRSASLPAESLRARSSSPASLASEASPVAVLPIDWVLTEAPAYHYRHYDRPGARGLPVLSDDGHPSNLARIVDPAEPGAPTGESVVARNASARQAATLATAAAASLTINQGDPE